MGKIADLINQMIQRSLTSAIIISPRFTDYRVAEILVTEEPDFENEIEELIKSQEKTVKKTDDEQRLVEKKSDKKIQENERKLNELLSGNIGDLKSLSTEQFGNIKSLATNPFGFMTRTILTKLRTGAGVLFIVAIAIEVAKFLIEELFKPGRMFDQRFREQIDKQVIQFLTRKEQAELRAGYKSLITTTVGGLRGDSLRGQIGGNFYSDPLETSIYDPSYVRTPRLQLKDMRKTSFQDVGAGASRSRQ